MESSERADQDMRVHTEAPAEGDTSQSAADTRHHTEDPAEGPDVQGEPSA